MILCYYVLEVPNARLPVGQAVGVVEVGPVVGEVQVPFFLDLSVAQVSKDTQKN